MYSLPLRPKCTPTYETVDCSWIFIFKECLLDLNLHLSTGVYWSYFKPCFFCAWFCLLEWCRTLVRHKPLKLTFSQVFVRILVCQWIFCVTLLQVLGSMLVYVRYETINQVIFYFLIFGSLSAFAWQCIHCSSVIAINLHIHDVMLFLAYSSIESYFACCFFFHVHVIVLSCISLNIMNIHVYRSSLIGWFHYNQYSRIHISFTDHFLFWSEIWVYRFLPKVGVGVWFLICIDTAVLCIFIRFNKQHVVIKMSNKKTHSLNFNKTTTTITKQCNNTQ